MSSPSPGTIPPAVRPPTEPEADAAGVRPGVEARVSWAQHVRQALHGLPAITPEGQVLAFLMMTASTMVVARGEPLLYLVLAIGLSTIAIGFAYPYLNTRRLTLHRKLPRSAFAGEPVWVELAVANRKPRLASFALVLADDGLATDVARDVYVHIPSVAPGEMARAGYFTSFPRRGQYRLRYVKLSSSFPFLLFSRQQVRRVNGPITIFPRPGRFHGLELPAPPGVATRADRPHQGGESFRGLREYRPGEDARRIHWKSSTRRGWGPPLVRELDSEQGEIAAVVVDPGLDGTPARLALQDRALGCCIALTRELRRRGYHVHFACAGDAGYFQVALGGRGGPSLRPLLVHLATYASNGERSLLDVVSQLRLPDSSRSLLVAVTASGGVGTAALQRAWGRGPVLRLDVESPTLRAIYDDAPRRARPSRA